MLKCDTEGLGRGYEMIAHEWLKNCFQEVLKRVTPLSVYTDILDVPIEKLSEYAKNQCLSLQNKYLPHYIVNQRSGNGDV